MKQALLLVGSPKSSRSTSESLGEYLLARLAEKGFQTERVRILAAVFKQDRIADFLAAVDRADLLVLASPLYVDSLPYPVIRALERIARHRCGHAVSGQRFLSIINCGFPEPIPPLQYAAGLPGKSGMTGRAGCLWEVEKPWEEKTFQQRDFCHVM